MSSETKRALLILAIVFVLGMAVGWAVDHVSLSIR